MGGIKQTILHHATVQVHQPAPAIIGTAIPMPQCLASDFIVLGNAGVVDGKKMRAVDGNTLARIAGFKSVQQHGVIFRHLGRGHSDARQHTGDEQHVQQPGSHH